MSLYVVNRDSGLALYAQIAQQLELVVHNQYASGECLPSEGDLAVQFGVNRHTLRRAIDELVEAGLLERRHGLGIFVLDTQLDYQIGKGTRFTENLAGACQGSCRLIYAAKGCLRSAFMWSATTESRSGLRVTAPIGDQSRVVPDQRAGLRSRALRYSSCRAARMA